MDRDTTERASKHRPDGSVIPISRGNVVLAGNSRGPPSSTPTASLTTEESTEKGKIGPPELECISNCSHEKNQVCRRYANGTRSHCVCKPGYARLKPSIPCKRKCNPAKYSNISKQWFLKLINCVWKNCSRLYIRAVNASGKRGQYGLRPEGSET